MTIAGPPAGASARASWRVVSASFETSAPSADLAPTEDLPEVAIAGRSNVGKSSLLNALCGQRGLARTSRTPGRTQLLNFFRLELAGPDAQRIALRCVDLPGYGYAAVHRDVRQGFAPMIAEYLGHRSALRALVVLVDVRRGFGELDEQLMGFAAERSLPTLVVGTKVDKLGKAQRGLVRRKLAEHIGADPSDVLLTSATSGAGLRGPDSLAADLAAIAGGEADAVAVGRSGHPGETGGKR